MAELQLPKLIARVRFPSSALVLLLRSRRRRAPRRPTGAAAREQLVDREAGDPEYPEVVDEAERPGQQLRDDVDRRDAVDERAESDEHCSCYTASIGHSFRLP